MAVPARVVFRRAGSADAGSVARLHADSWRRHYRNAYSDEFLDGDVDSERFEVWTERLSILDGPTSTIVAEVGSCMVGFVHVIFDDDDRYGSLIDNLHVVFDRKRRGIGTQLMSRAAAAVVEREARGLYLWVLEQNTAAQAFYRTCGGRCTGRRLVQSPGGVPGRLHGSPVACRYTWTDPESLIV
ncbi:MAG: GNAT family N-acetyltransferase [Acidimicrobiales bacterium]